MKNKIILIVVAVTILLSVFGVIYFMFYLKPKAVPVIISTNSDVFLLQSVKLNQIDSSEDTLPETANAIANEIKIENNLYRRKYNKDDANIEDSINTRYATYTIQQNSEWSNETVLLKNYTELWSKMLVFTTFDPIRSFFVSDDKVVLAYDHFPSDSKREMDVVIEGISMNEKYNLKSSFAAYTIDSKVLFFAQKEDVYYLVLDERFYALEPSIEEIIDPPCCMPAAYAVNAGGNQIEFFSKNKDGYWYQNIITLK